MVAYTSFLRLAQRNRGQTGRSRSMERGKVCAVLIWTVYRGMTGRCLGEMLEPAF